MFLSTPRQTPLSQFMEPAGLQAAKLILPRGVLVKGLESLGVLVVGSCHTNTEKGRSEGQDGLSRQVWPEDQGQRYSRSQDRVDTYAVLGESVNAASPHDVGTRNRARDRDGWA